MESNDLMSQVRAFFSWLGSALSDLLGGGELGAAVHSATAGLPTFAAHAGLTFLIIYLGVRLYALRTRHSELKLIREGNTAAAIDTGGIILGMSLPVSIAMLTSLNWADIVVWGVASVLVQILAFRFFEFVLVPNASKKIAANDTAAATLLAAVNVAVGFVLAAAVWGMPLARG